MQFTDSGLLGPEGSREFYFPNRFGVYLAICAYLDEGDSRNIYGPKVVYVGGPVINDIDIGGRDIRRYIATPPEGIRHAAATGDPYPLIDWLLENACADRPWLAEAIGRALAIST